MQTTSIPIKYSSPYSTLNFIDKSNLSIANYNKRKKINNVPLTSASHRSVIPSRSCVFSPVSLEMKQKKLKNFFSRVNSDQRLLTARILKERQDKQDIKQDKDNSFFERYDPYRLTFSHKLIGKVSLPRVVFNIIPQEQELERIRSPTIKPLKKPLHLKSVRINTGGLDTTNNPRRVELSRRAFTSLSHLKHLKFDLPSRARLAECLPGQSYGLPKSKVFLEACRDGNIETVHSLLLRNKWLAHTFDSTGQSGLHWSVKRSQFQIAALLMKFGTWVDTCDFVRII